MRSIRRARLLLFGCLIAGSHWSGCKRGAPDPGAILDVARDAGSDAGTDGGSDAGGFASSVLTYHNDNARTGQNLHETILTPLTVASGAFGRLFARSVDGLVQAQPLYVPGVAIPSKGVHNVLFVATQRNTVYAFDADDPAQTAPLWQANLGPPAVMVRRSDGGAEYEDYPGFKDIVPSMGITGTPVIELPTATLYVVAFVQEVLAPGSNRYHQVLHALDLATGHERDGSPVEIAGAVAGTGYDSDGGVVVFQPDQQLQRPGLALSRGTVYVAFASHEDGDPYHGWLFAYRSFDPSSDPNRPDAGPLAQLGAFATTANNARGGIWMSGAAPAVDEDGDVYFLTGNGSPSRPGDPDYGQSFVRVRLTETGIHFIDRFTPFNRDELDLGDLDLGAGGALLLPRSVGSAAHPRLMVGAGKEGTIYLIDRDRMGGFHPPVDGGSPGLDDTVVTLRNAMGSAFDCPAYFNGRIYYVGVGDVPQAFGVVRGAIVSKTVPLDSPTFEFPGATPSISANGLTDGIVWVTENIGIIDPDHGYGIRGALLAFDADYLAKLYDSVPTVSEADYGYAKFSVPTVVNGKVYVGTKASVLVFGLR